MPSFFIAPLYLLVVSTYAIIFLDPGSLRYLAKEDGPIENLAVVFFLLSSCIFAILYIKSFGSGNNFGPFHTDRNIFYLLLALLFLFGAGEEISWGYRLFNWESPKFFREYNIQGETTIHNLYIFHGTDRDWKLKTGFARMFTISRMFSIFWFSYCVVIPLMNKFIRRVNNFCKHTGFPVPPLWIGFLFLTNFVVFRISYYNITGSPIFVLDGLNEIKESYYAFIFAVFAFHLLWEKNKVTNINERN